MQVIGFSLVFRTPLKYSNKTYTCTQNTLIEQSFTFQGTYNKGVVYTTLCVYWPSCNA